jgi:hypothetical protein
MTSGLYCKYCDVNCSKQSDWDRHIYTIKHKRAQNFVQEITPKFECLDCDYICSRKSILVRHELSNKHKLKIVNKNSIDSNLTCDAYVVPQSIQSNTTVPKITPIVPEITPSDYMTIITQLLNQNNELKNFIIDQSTEHKNFIIDQSTEHKNFISEQANEHKKETVEIISKVIEQTKTINNNTITNNSKAFNINMYLNEQCKDAMNFSDFINGIEVTHEDLENNAQLGFVGGISKILIDNLKLMNKNERPIHCTDAKRETMYIKDDNKWSKEEDDSKLRSAIQEITRKSICSLIGWKRGNPESDDMDSKFSGRCIVIQQQSMAGYNREVYYPKVIHAIAREVLVNK